MKLSILIPSTFDRKDFLSDLLSQINNQCELISERLENDIIVYTYKNNVECLVFIDNYKYTIGEKRNVLLKQAKGEYTCFIDSDDSISSDYIVKVLKAIESNPDCCSLTGVITWDGVNPEIFEHSIKYKAYKTNTNNEPIKYERYPNPLNVIKREIAQQFTFVSSNFGEDTQWATDIFNAGVLKTESTIEGVIYHYKYRTKK